jgi:dipeptidyl aminopeptidase/acylaminoacyl peptidase
MKNRLLFLFSFLIFSELAAQNSKIQVTDLTKIKQVSTIIVAPDASKALYSLKTMEQNAENKEEYDYRNHLFLVDEKKQTRQLTRGTESASQPAFSPDSKSIAFVRFVKSKPQIFIMPLDGGEAWQLTKLKSGATSPVFSPDGSKILFSVSYSLTELLKDSVMNEGGKLPKWPFEKPGLSNAQTIINPKTKPNPDGNLEEIRAYLAKDVEDKKAKVFTGLNFQTESSTDAEMYFSHIFMIDVKENAKETALTKGYLSFDTPVWNIDGKSIYLNCKRDENVHPDRMPDNKIIQKQIVDLSEKIIFAEDGVSFYILKISPNGKWMVVDKNANNKLSYSEAFLVQTEGLKAERINLDRGIGIVKFTEDSKIVYFTANSNGGTPLFKFDISSKKIEQLSTFDEGILTFDLVKNKIYFAKTQIENPCEIYVSDLSFKNTTKLSTFNDEWLAGKVISKPEKRIYTNSLGQKVEYWIMKPANFEAGKKYPLLLNMHGGPTAMWGPGEFSMWHELQFFCAKGYGVVYANPRGSGGYGKDFQFANYRDWGVGPTEDVLAAATDAAKETWVDTARQVITGGSYAGYLTAWIVGHDNRFKAAFSQRGVYDLKTFMGEGNAWRLTPNYFGLPWENEETTKIQFNSPINYVDKIKTPLLIKHGENDLRTGVIQYEIFG